MFRPDLETFTCQYVTMGVAVTWTRLPGGLAGCYHHDLRTILLGRCLEDWQAAPVLLHEMAHAAAGRDGHQDPATSRPVPTAPSPADSSPLASTRPPRTPSGPVSAPSASSSTSPPGSWLTSEPPCADYLAGFALPSERGLEGLRTWLVWSPSSCSP